MGSDSGAYAGGNRHVYRFITTSAGETFDVPHPDMVLVGRREVVVGIPGADGSTYHEQIARIGILHITSLRDLPVPAAPPA